MATSVLYPFVCPVCGQTRAISHRVLKSVERGTVTGQCRTGEGCRQLVSRPERRRRWWLRMIGNVTDLEVRRAGGAVAYVARFGLPGRLQWPLPSDATAETLADAAAPVLDSNASRLARYCYERSGRDAELALWIAVEMLARGVQAPQVGGAAAPPRALAIAA